MVGTRLVCDFAVFVHPGAMFVSANELSEAAVDEYWYKMHYSTLNNSCLTVKNNNKQTKKN